MGNTIRHDKIPRLERHAYAIRRFQELAGFPCPAAGGPRRTQLTPWQQWADKAARETLCLDMGHHNPAVMAVYLGR